MATDEDTKQLLVGIIEKLSLRDRQELLEMFYRMPAKTRAKIPGQISLTHYTEINRLLLEVLSDTNAMQVVARLNETGKEEPAPVFVGWVEDDKRARVRLQTNDSHPALLRAGDRDSSTTYEMCFCNGIVERDWMNPNHVQQRKSIELCLSQKTGVNYLRVIRIEVSDENQQRLGVGVLGAGFSAKPDDLDKVDDILRSWAQSDKHDLVPYLTKNFELGGRVL
jgi:hypothetical protein